MNKWPQDWREQILVASDIPVTPFALEVLAAWRKSTPCEPWTNNPLGIPAQGFGMPRALDTPYAVFPLYSAFVKAITSHLSSNKGKGLASALISADSKPAAWREIHAQQWPANQTESDYPAVLMDEITSAYTDSVQRASDRKRTSAGTQLASPQAHEAVKQQGMALHHAATTFSDASRAIAHIMRRLG